MNFKVSKKVNGKWQTFGNVKTNQYGNLTLGMKVTPELMRELSALEGKWINFALFEADEEKQSKPPVSTAPDDAEIPF